MLDVVSALKALRRDIRLFVLRAKMSIEDDRTFQKQESFQCNVCGHACVVPASLVEAREATSCFYCGSTLRFRAIVNALSIALFGKSVVLDDFPTSERIVGVGMSDSGIYARRLGKKLGYTNTYYHKAPRLDITQITEEQFSTVDFVISTDVFEHVPPPVDLAFRNLFLLLKDKGFCIITVPFKKSGDTQEHYPELNDFSITKNNGKSVLINRTKEGNIQEFDNLRFHGGPGSTLEMRIFSEESLVRSLEHAGFQRVRVFREAYPEHGISWERSISVPVVAWKGDG